MRTTRVYTQGSDPKGQRFILRLGRLAQQKTYPPYADWRWVNRDELAEALNEGDMYVISYSCLGGLGTSYPLSILDRCLEIGCKQFTKASTKVILKWCGLRFVEKRGSASDYLVQKIPRTVRRKPTVLSLRTKTNARRTTAKGR
jgi:hypothetical protein